jgi:hypothetical protein
MDIPFPPLLLEGFPQESRFLQSDAAGGGGLAIFQQPDATAG